MKVTGEPFGNTSDGQPVELFTLVNRNGVNVKITNYGGIVTAINVPDKNGNLRDVVLGFDSLEPYLNGHPYFGAIIGRYCNRIANARFTLADKKYSLAANDGKNHLHGGEKGFDKKVWRAEPYYDKNKAALHLYYTSKDGEEGYPGNLSVQVIYSLNRENQFRIHYQAQTDAATPINLTHHGYFNLKGAGEGDILDQLLTVHASKYAPTDKHLIPKGKLEPVANTPLDFTTPKAIGERINKVKGGYGGYDVSYLVDGWVENGPQLRKVAEVVEPVSGREMHVLSTEPDIHFYSANYLDGSIKGKDGKAYGKHSAFCLEAQHFPDSLNNSSFPSTVLEPGRTYTQTTVYSFLVKED